MVYGRTWCVEEDRLLKSRWCAGIPLERIARELHRERCVVRNRLRTLGLYDLNVRGWTKEADEHLSALWFDLSITTKQIAQRLGKEIRQVRYRARFLELPNRTQMHAETRAVKPDHREPRAERMGPEIMPDLDEAHVRVCLASGGFAAFSETWAGRGSVPQSLSWSKDWKLGPIEPAMRRAA